MPPDTRPYFIAAYVVAALLYGGYAVSLWLRTRRARAALADAAGTDGVTSGGIHAGNNASS